jgi:hypothetical protein
MTLSVYHHLLARAALASVSFIIVASVAAAAPNDWVITFGDDFDGESLNSSRWNVAHNMTHGPRELQLYLSDEVYLEGGDLVIRTQRRTAHFNSTHMYVMGWLVAILA